MTASLTLGRITCTRWTYFLPRFLPVCLILFCGLWQVGKGVFHYDDNVRCRIFLGRISSTAIVDELVIWWSGPGIITSFLASVCDRQICQYTDLGNKYELYSDELLLGNGLAFRCWIVCTLVWPLVDNIKGILIILCLLEVGFIFHQVCGKYMHIVSVEVANEAEH